MTGTPDPARLIEAAPELLNVTRELYDILLHGLTRDYEDMVIQLGRARAVLLRLDGTGELDL